MTRHEFVVEKTGRRSGYTVEAAEKTEAQQGSHHACMDNSWRIISISKTAATQCNEPSKNFQEKQEAKLPMNSSPNQALSKIILLPSSRPIYSYKKKPAP